MGFAADPAVTQRRMILRREELSSCPRQLRANLKELDALLQGSDAWVRRRIRLMFGEVVAKWQHQGVGEPIIATIEILPGAVRVSLGDGEGRLTPSDWAAMVSPAIQDLIDGWGMDRRSEGQAWFEFCEAPR